jgi:glycosyltransferase involved in cell wall biosynthesis
VKEATILIALYKAGDFLSAKIESLQKQTYFDKSTIILLNCQNLEQESEIYSDFVANNENVIVKEYKEWTMLYPTWNDGITMTSKIQCQEFGVESSKYIMNSNVDDMLHPEYVEECCKFLDHDLTYGVVSTEVLVADKPNQIWPDWDHMSRMPIGYRAGGTAGPCPMWRRSLHENYGLFGNYRVIGDARMWEKWHSGGVKFGIINKDMVLYFFNADSLERRLNSDGVQFRHLDIDGQ